MKRFIEASDGTFKDTNLFIVIVAVLSLIKYGLRWLLSLLGWEQELITAAAVLIVLMLLSYVVLYIVHYFIGLFRFILRKTGKLK